MQERDKKILTAVLAIAVATSACELSEPILASTPTPDTSTAEVTPTQEIQVTSGVLSEVTDAQKHDKIVSSLPSDRPEAQGGNSEIKTFQIAAGGDTFDLAMYQLSPEALANQLPIELKDADGQTTQVVEGVALFTQSNHYDGSTSMERLIAIPVKTDSGVGVTWVYDENGYPTEAGQSIDLTRAVFAYNVPVAAGSKLSFAPLTSKPEEIVRYGLPNPLTITIDGDPPSPMTVDVSLSNGIGTPVSGESTAVPPPTPELPTATPEVSFNRVTGPENKSAMSTLTLEDTRHDFASWVKKTCDNNIVINPSKIKFEVGPVPSLKINLLDSMNTDNNNVTGFNLARNVELCETNIAKMNPVQFGLDGKNDIFIVPYIWRDSAGNEFVFQFAQGQKGIDIMKEKGAFTDHNGPRLSPADGLGSTWNDQSFLSGDKGGPDDATQLGKIDSFYENQGITKAEVLALFNRIADPNNHGVISAEDRALIESIVFLGHVNIAPSSN